MPSAAERPAAPYRFLIALSTVAVLFLGFLALGRLPVDLLPSRDVPSLRVLVAVPGLTATVIDEKITQPLETALTGATGVTSVESITTPGRVAVNLYLRQNRVIDAARQDVSARLEHIRTTWPASIDPPVISIIDASSDVIEFAITSRRRDGLALRDWTENEFANRLRELSGVSEVDVQGGALREILVQPDQRRLAGFGLSFDDVFKAIRKTPQADAGMRAPSPKGRARRELIQSGNAVAVAGMPVALPSGESIPLSEVAKITLRIENDPGSFRFDGGQAVKVTVQKQPSAAMSDVVERIHAHVEWMRANRLIPAGIDIHPLSRRLDEARNAIRQITMALIGGIALVLLVAHLLLGEGRRTLILGVIVATSLQTVFIAMALTRLALDVVTLGALTLGSGLLGACAIVVFENITRFSRDKLSPLRIVMTVAVTIPAALAPVLLAGGEIGTVFQEFVAVYGGAWLVSAVLSLLLVPAFDARARRHGREHWNALISHAIARMRQSYSGILRHVLRRPLIVLLLTLLFTGAVAQRFLHETQEFPPPDGRRAGEIVLRLLGPDRGQLAVLADNVAQQLRAIPGLHDVKNSAQAHHEELAVKMDEERAHALGIDITDAGKALAIALNGIPAGSFRDAEHRYDIRMQLPPADAANDAALGKLLLLGELSDRPAVHLRDVATLVHVDAPDRILRYNGMPMIELSAMPANGAVSTQAMEDLRALFNHDALPAGYRIFYGGIGKASGESQSRDQGLKILGWALLLVLIVQALMHRSLLRATLVTFTACFALAGAGAAVLIFSIPLASSVWIGALTSVGVAAACAAAVAAQIAASRRQGSALRTTVAQAAKHQFRPLLAVTLMALSGMLPLLSVDAGATVLFPLVIVGATGVVFSLVASLLLLPAFCMLSARKEQNRVRRRL